VLCFAPPLLVVRCVVLQCSCVLFTPFLGPGFAPSVSLYVTVNLFDSFYIFMVYSFFLQFNYNLIVIVIVIVRNYVIELS
jgi:hypothetical protein